MSHLRSHRFSRAGDPAPDGAPTPLLRVSAETAPLPIRVAPAEPGGQEDALRTVAAFVRAGERMDEAGDLSALWPLVAAEATSLLGAKAVVMEWTGRQWAAVGGTEVETPGALPDPELDGAGGRVAVVAGHARSVLVTTLDCAALRPPTRLVWTSPVADAFLAGAGVAEEYTRFVSGAVRRTHHRMNLLQAATARHRIGVAQGMLMAAQGLSAEATFDLMVRRSENSNVKLSALAEQVIATGDTDSEADVPPPSQRLRHSADPDGRDGAGRLGERPVCAPEKSDAQTGGVNLGGQAS